VSDVLDLKNLKPNTSLPPTPGPHGRHLQSLTQPRFATLRASFCGEAFRSRGRIFAGFLARAWGDCPAGFGGIFGEWFCHALRVFQILFRLRIRIPQGFAVFAKEISLSAFNPFRPRGRSGSGSARHAGSLRADELLVGLKRLRRRLWHGAGHMGRTHHE